MSEAVEEAMERMIKRFYGDKEADSEELKLLFPAMAAKALIADLSYEERNGSVVNSNYLAQIEEPVLELLEFFR